MRASGGFARTCLRTLLFGLGVALCSSSLSAQPCVTSSVDNAGVFFVLLNGGGRSPLPSSLPLYSWRQHFTLLSRVDTLGREITGSDPNYSPAVGYDPQNKHLPHDPDGSAQAAWLEGTYSLYGSLGSVLFHRLGNCLNRDGAIAPAFETRELSNSLLKITFNSVWGNAISEITYRPADSNPGARQIVASDNIGELVQSALFVATGTALDTPCCFYNPTEAGGIDEYDTGNTLRWAGSPVLSTVFSAAGQYPQTLTTELQPLNFYQYFATDGATPGLDRYSPLLWQGTFQKVTTLGFPVSHGVCDASGGTHCDDVIRVAFSAKSGVPAVQVPSGTTMHSAFYLTIPTASLQALNLISGQMSLIGSGNASGTITDHNTALIAVSSDPAKPSVGVALSPFTPSLAGHGLQLSYYTSAPNTLNVIVNTTMHKMGNSYLANTDESLMVVGDAATVRYRLAQVYCEKANCLPLAAPAMTMSPSGSVAAGTPIVFTASASGSVPPLEYRIWRYDTSTATWRVVRDYSTMNTFTWTAGAADVGQHIMAYWVRSVGSPLQYEASSGTPTFTITPPPLSCSSVSVSPASPVTGSVVTFTANCSGGVAPLQYDFWLYNVATSSFVTSSGYRTNTSWSWTPSPSQTGTWSVGVWVKNANSTALYDTIVSTPNFTVRAPVLSCTSVSVSPPTPVRYGTTLSFTANCTGGVAPLQYQFWLYNVTTQSFVFTTGYSTSKTWSWTPSSSQVSTWNVGVWVKNANSTNPYDTIVGTANFNVTN